ncbi:HGGxSTG domain-containing protein [Lysobacter sp. A3-1-A15]|uniref:HGGxSTG domain-containing protein n=1 Tax=Novilysobacter viscosus TaxID=3098602 RepID=UPI00398353D2
MGPRYPLNIHSGALDAIIREWAFLKGLGPDPAAVEGPKRTPRPELSDPNARANDFGSLVAARVVCGAKRRRDGQPCEAHSVPGKRRCKWHGGCSTGPRTAEGKARVTSNLSAQISSNSTGCAA